MVLLRSFPQQDSKMIHHDDVNQGQQSGETASREIYRLFHCEGAETHNPSWTEPMRRTLPASPLVV